MQTFKTMEEINYGQIRFRKIVLKLQFVFVTEPECTSEYKPAAPRVFGFWMEECCDWKYFWGFIPYWDCDTEKITDIFYCIHNAFIGKRQVNGDEVLMNGERRWNNPHSVPFYAFIGKRWVDFNVPWNVFFGRGAEEQTSLSKREYRPGAPG